MPTRRALLASALAAAIRPPAVGAQTSSAPGPSATAAPTTVLELQRRTIEVNGQTRLGVRHSPTRRHAALLPRSESRSASGSRTTSISRA